MAKLANLVNKALDNQFVKKLESYVHLDLKYFVKNFSYLTFTRVVGMGLGLLVTIAFARLLSKEIYGQYNYIIAIIGILAIFSLPGMGTAITQAVARGYDGTLITGIKERFKWSILGSVAVLGVGTYYFLDGSILLGKCFMISSLFFPFFENFRVYHAFLTGKKAFGKIAKYQIMIETLSILATFLAIYFTRNLILILIAFLGSNALLRGYFFRLTSKNMENQSNDPEAISFGRHMTVQGIPGMITAHGDKIIIGLLLSFPELAIYSIAIGFQRLIRSLMSPIAGLSFPKLAQMGETEAYSAVKKWFPYLMLVTVIACGIAITVCPYIIPFLYSQKYTASIFYAQILLAALIFGIPSAIFGKALFPAQRKIKELYLMRLRPLVEIALLIPLTLTFGILGVVLAKLLASLFGMVYNWRLAKWI